MKEIVADAGLVGYCGLYCGACGTYLREQCRGCHQNESASWCMVRACCREQDTPSCADCAIVTDPKDCRKFINFMPKPIGLVLRADRRACILQIRKRGLRGHAEEMALLKRQTIRP
jgi:hypothetical protein